MTEASISDTVYVLRSVSPLGGDRIDLVLADGKIQQVGAAQVENLHSVVEIDASRLIALPGLVDLHTHLREPGREDAETVESGTAAAAPSPTGTFCFAA